jgi:hypothetical protein
VNTSPKTLDKEEATLMLKQIVPNQKNHLPKFIAWREKNFPPTECTEDRIDEHLYLWVGCLDLTPPSKKTYFLTTLGEWGLLNNKYYPETK